MFLQREFSQLGDLAAFSASLKRGDGCTALQFDLSKEGRTHVVFEGQSSNRVPNGAEPLLAIPTKVRYANVRAIIRAPNGTSRVLIAHKSAMNNAQFKTLDPILARLAFGDGGDILRNDPLAQSMHLFAGRTSKLRAFLTTKKAPVDLIEQPEEGDGEFTTIDEALIGTFASKRAWGVPLAILEETKLTGKKIPWSLAYEGQSAFAWASRPLPKGGIILGSYGVTAMDAHNNAMVAQGFRAGRGSNGRLTLEPVTDPIPCGGKDAVAFEGLTAGNTANELYAVFRPLTETSHEAPLPIIQSVNELHNGWRTLIDAMIRPN